ncbi:MAG: helix-turn-helix domain-containing protein [Acidimicrobiaceae bacterium]|nr:helix-turn-helix domain-containing protein [Acidimicrobiaceae bacterium]
MTARRPTPAERLAEAIADLIDEAVNRATANPVSTNRAITVSVAEAAERLAVGTTTVKTLIASGELPSVLVGDRRLIPVAALEAFIADRAAG